MYNNFSDFAKIQKKQISFTSLLNILIQRTIHSAEASLVKEYAFYSFRVQTTLLFQDDPELNSLILSYPCLYDKAPKGRLS